MSQEQTRPVAVVTGGGSGIGRETALKFHEAGFSTVIADINAEAAADTLSVIGSAGTAMAVHADVRRESDVAKMITVAVDTFGRLDVLVNNAGVGGAFGSVAEIDAEDWDFTFEVLTRGAFFGIKHAVPAMTTGGCIVNIASVAAYSGSFASIAYSSAKAAVLGMTRAAAVELAARRIRVNAVCPGVMTA